MTVHLRRGAHNRRADGMCAMEAAAYLAGEPHSDHPQCVSPAIIRFLVSWNDSLPDDATRDRLLKPLLALTLHTRTTAADEQRRVWLMIDWLVRVHASEWLVCAGLNTCAGELRALPPLTSRYDAAAVRSIIGKACAELTAAGAAARAAAWDAAGAAAWAAAGAALAPTVRRLQASAQQLVRRMCAVGDVPERPMRAERLAKLLA